MIIAAMLGQPAAKTGHSGVLIAVALELESLGGPESVNATLRWMR